MKRISILTALTIMLAGGIASADHGRHRGHWDRGGRGGWSGGWSAGVVVRAPRVIQPRFVVVQRPRVVRPVVVVQPQPTYVEPTYVAPPPPPQPQIWIEGRWNWTGYNWQWIDGHYEVQVQQQPVYDEPCDY